MRQPRGRSRSSSRSATAFAGISSSPPNANFIMSAIATGIANQAKPRWDRGIGGGGRGHNQNSRLRKLIRGLVPSGAERALRLGSELHVALDRGPGFGHRLLERAPGDDASVIDDREAITQRLGFVRYGAWCRARRLNASTLLDDRPRAHGSADRPHSRLVRQDHPTGSWIRPRGVQAPHHAPENRFTGSFARSRSRARANLGHTTLQPARDTPVPPVIQVFGGGVS